MENNEKDGDDGMWTSFYGSREASEAERPHEEDDSPDDYGAAGWNRQGIATASMILGIISIAFLGAGIVSGIIAIIFGIISLKGRGRKMAIAGIVTGIIGAIIAVCVLLLWLVFLPMLQASQRNVGRKNDVSVIVTRVVALQAYNKGDLPDVSKISTSDLSLIESITSSGQPTTEKAVYVVGVNCDGQQLARTYSISIKLENGSTYCQDM